MEAKINLEPVAVKPATAARMLECGTTTISRLIKEGKLQTVRVGADQRVTVEFIKRYTELSAQPCRPRQAARRSPTSWMRSCTPWVHTEAAMTMSHAVQRTTTISRRCRSPIRMKRFFFTATQDARRRM